MSKLDDIWVGLQRAKDVRNAAIEECARVATSAFDGLPYEDGRVFWSEKIAAAIRALKEKP